MRKGVCKHYKGRHGCALGINLRQLVGGDNFGWMRRIPCNVEAMRGTRLAAIDPVSCSSYDEPTDTEIKAQDDRTERGLKAMRDVVEGGRTDVPCPECGDTLGPGGCPAGCITWRVCRAAAGPRGMEPGS